MPPGSEEVIGLLYVEDELETRQLVSKMLAARYRDLELHTAADGAQGLDLFRVARPQLVVTDVRMPVMDGLQMAVQIKAIDPDVCLIALTAYNDGSFLKKAEEIGFSDYVLKPIDYKLLFAIIDKSLAGIREKQ